MFFKSYEGRILERILVILCATITLMLAVIFINIYAPSIESKLLPVVSNFKIEAITWVSDTEIIMHGSFTQLRGECKLDSLVAYTTDANNIQIKYPAKIEFLGIDSGNITFRAIGTQKWGPWKLASNQELNGDTLNIISYHNCHGMYLVPTRSTRLIETTISTKPNITTQGIDH